MRAHIISTVSSSSLRIRENAIHLNVMVRFMVEMRVAIR